MAVPMKTKIDLENWSRKDYFSYFGGVDDPYFGVVVNVDCTVAYNQCKHSGTSFFLTYLYHSIEALNKIENFRYRLIDGEVWLFDLVHASSTVGRGDGSFGFGFFEYVPGDFEGFCCKGAAEIEAVKACSGLRANGNAKRFDVVHFTVLPWFSFTGFKHERNFTRSESIPKVAFGKFFEVNGKKLLPVSVNANHGLVDAYHVGKYLEYFQEALNRTP
jgi:chloramphenicol O-acetyltransferase type A